MKNSAVRFLTSQNFKNAAWNLVNTASYPLFVILATPFFIHRLGPEQYGIWMLINTTTQLMSIFNLGLGDTAIKYISNHRALGEEVKIRQTTKTITGIGVGVFWLAVALGIVLFLILGKSEVFSIRPAFRQMAAGSALLAFVLFGLKFLEQIVLSVFQGFERYDFASVLSLASRISILAVNVIFVFLGFTLLEVFASSAVTLVVFLAVEMILAKKQFPSVSWTPGYDKESIREVFSFGLWSWIQSLLAIITTQADKFIVAAVSGVQLLTYYSLGSLMTTQIHGGFTSISAWVFPAVSGRSARQEPLNTFYRKTDLALVGFGFTCIITFLLLEKPLLTLWLGPETYEKAILYIRVFVYYNIFLLLNVLPYYFLNGSGHVRENTLVELITKLLNVAGLVSGYFLWGTVGLIWGLVLSMLLATPLRITFLRRYLLKTPNPLLGAELLLCPACIVLFFEYHTLLLKTIFAVSFFILFYVIYLRPWKTKRGEAKA